MITRKIDKGTTHIILDVFLENNGIKRKLRMALDTGATHVMIPNSFMELLNIKSDQIKEKGELVSATGVEPVSIAVIEKINALRNEAKNVEVMVHNLPSKSYVDGLLGLSFLKNFNVHINFKEGVLEIN
ncbi:clan AA aspartic protease [Candidatus Woesearchaeota archaeon]|nr:clan AA aspartic protease [Candidatus Woesearchaeota archaeon]